MRTHNTTYVNRLGFTLIELLVVITIIGILAVGSVTVYTSQIQKARDSTRVTDLSALRAAVEQYYNDKYEYPSKVSHWVNGSGTSVQEYSPSFAEDPKANQGCIKTPCDYVYAVADDKNGIANGSYEISTGFENQGNVDARADNSKDNGSDPNRLEVGLLTGVGGAAIKTGYDNTPNAISNANISEITSNTTAEAKHIIVRKSKIYQAPTSNI